MDETRGPVMRHLRRRLDPGSPTGLPLTVALVLSLGFFAGFLAIAEEVAESAQFAFDASVHAGLAAAVSPLVTRAMWIATLLCDWRVVIVETLAAVLVFLAWGRVRRAVAIVALVVAGSAAASLLKNVFQRPRPSSPLALIAIPGSASFPSGHAITALMLFGGLGILLVASGAPRWARLSGAAAAAAAVLAVGMSRVYLGVHFASDVVASWLLGGAMLAPGIVATLAWERFGKPWHAQTLSRGGRWLVVGLCLAGVVGVVFLEALANPLL